MHTPTLSINLAALKSNYRLLRDRHAAKNISAVVKADAYGLGMKDIALALAQVGCTQFFVATLSEAIALRSLLPNSAIGVFNGIFAGEGIYYKEHHLLPVINDLAQIEYATGMDAILHIDTGMTRLGLSESDAQKISGKIMPYMIMSHLACANKPDHPKNAEQLERFRAVSALFPGVKTSFCNSSGLFLSRDFHGDMGRPGCALYGINPTHGKNPMQHIATLSAPLLQVRTLDRDEEVGYGATFKAKKGARIAIAALGYADGWMRCLSNKGHAYISGHKVPLIGRVSMDMVALDVTSVPENALANARAEFINEQQTVDAIAEQCGTIGYEIFTRLGQRVKRLYF